MKRVLSLVLVLVLVLGTIVPAFAEEATTTAAEMTAGETLKAYGAIDGTDNGLEEERPITRAEMAVIYAQLNGKIEDAKAWPFAPTFTDMEGHWAINIVAYAEDQGWMVGAGPGTPFRPEEEMTAAEVNVMLMKVLGHPVVWETVTEDAAALGIAVTTADATQALRGEVFEAMVVALDEMPLGSEVTLGSTLENLTGYVAPVVVPETYEATAVVKDVDTFEVTFNKAVEEGAATIKVMKGLAMYNSTVEWNEEMTVATVTTVVNLPAGDYVVKVEGLEDEALVSDITVETPVETTFEITGTTVDLADGAEVAYVVKSQYGAEMAVTFADVVESAYNVTNGNVEAVAADADTFDFASLVTDAKAELNDVIRITAFYKGLNAVAEVTVIEPAESGSIAFGTVGPLTDETRITVGDAGLTVPYTLFNQFGTERTLPLHNAADGDANIETIDLVQFTSSNDAIVDVDTLRVDADGVLTVDAGATAGTAVVTAFINEYGAIATFTVTIEATAAADTVVLGGATVLVAATEEVELSAVIYDQYGTKLDSDAGVTWKADGVAIAGSPWADDVLTVPGAAADTAYTITAEIGGDVVATTVYDIEAAAVATSITAVDFPSLFEELATDTIEIADVTVLDQYGREFTPGAIAVVEVANTVGSMGVAGLDFTATAVEGSETYTVTADGEASTAFNFTLTTVDPTDIVSYEINAIGTLYADDTAGGTHDVAVTLVGKTAAAASVVLVSDAPELVTSSNANVKVNGTDLYGGAAGTATVTAWVNGVAVDTQEVTASTDAPVAASVVWDAAVLAEAANASTIVTVKDQYGEALVTTLFFATADGTVINTTGLALDQGDGSVTQIDTVVEVTVITSNGLSATKTITTEDTDA
jgi:hypothetical protein